MIIAHNFTFTELFDRLESMTNALPVGIGYTISFGTDGTHAPVLTFQIDGDYRYWSFECCDSLDKQLKILESIDEALYSAIHQEELDAQDPDNDLPW